MNIETYLEGGDRASLEMHLEAVVQRHWRVFGGGLSGGDREGGRRGRLTRNRGNV